MSDAQPDSAETVRLLQQIRAGDRQAVEQLFAGHRPYLRRFVELRLDPRLRPRVDASDVVQEACLGAYLERPPMPLRLWLRQIALGPTLKARRYHLGTARRTLDREVPLPEQPSLLLAGRLLAAGSTPGQHLDRHELARRLRQAVAQLPEADREVILMRHFEGLSNQEVGCLLGIDPATASKRHGRAMLWLHHLLFERGLAESQL
jgi:RNA polymerase sigma-70 factor (ECF subfamily)